MLGINNQRTREKLLREPDLTLEKAWELVRAAETTEKHLKDLQNESVHSIKNGKASRMRKYNQEQQPKSSKNEKFNQTSVFDCRNCGTKHGKKECPAYGKTCHNCHKHNHYKKMCRSKKKVHFMEHEEDSDLETLIVGAVTTEVKNDELFVNTKINGQITRLKVDTGSQVNILPMQQLKKIVGPKPNLNTCSSKLISYSENNLTVMGTIKALIH